MFLKELIRFSSQHRTFYCYLILSIWIFLLIAGMYKYVGFGTSSENFLNSGFIRDARKEIRIKAKECDPPSGTSEEGGSLEGWTLQGVLILTRHGDRGSIYHVRDTENVDCSGGEETTLLEKYRNFLKNFTTSGSTQALWKMGPFHGFPLLPDLKACLLGQLTTKGISQLLHIGELLRNAYGPKLNLHLKHAFLTTRPNSTEPTAGFYPEEIVIYSTRYRRTFQSAMALMFALIPPERWITLNPLESHSFVFCFSDCACPRADSLKTKIEKDRAIAMTHHPAITAIVQWLGTALLENPSAQIQALEVRDAILTFMCHDAALPCRKLLTVEDSYGEISNGRSTSGPDVDVINIDQEENQVTNQNGDSKWPTKGGEGNGYSCIEQHQVQALMTFTNWQCTKDAKTSDTKSQALLRTYGLVRNLVGHMLRMISGERTKFVLYSAHDRTLQGLATVLGIDIGVFVPYASRMNFELYRSDTDEQQYYFRLVYNGADITNQISFCEGGKSLRVSKGIRRSKADLCPIENIIRFLHDDYFTPLNATNFKDACTMPLKINPVMSNYL